MRARLLARLATELGYERDGTRREAASREAVERARRLDDQAVLAAALGARHVALWGPDHAQARLRCATEMLTAAQQAGAHELELQARNWRALDLLELGHGQKLRAEIDAFAALAARARLPTYSWYVPMWRATIALMEGRVEEGMQLALHCALPGSPGRRCQLRDVLHSPPLHPADDGRPTCRSAGRVLRE